VVIAAPGLYVGTIRHRRFAPRPHQFQYSLFMAFLDVDRLRETMAISRFTSYNRWNWAAFDQRDHPGDPRRPLRDRLADSAAADGEVLPDGPIYVLTHLRYAGYVFNPISLFYCHDRAGTLRLVLADVSNTYGGRRRYWLRVTDDPAPRFRAVTAKALYVSPFMEREVDYEFLMSPPGQGLVVHMNVTRAGSEQSQAGRLFDATLTLRYTPWTARAVRGALLRFPLMTAKVTAAIYWEALRLRLKGLPVMPLPGESG
jgi:uncharacterized protein